MYPGNWLPYSTFRCAQLELIFRHQPDKCKYGRFAFALNVLALFKIMFLVSLIFGPCLPALGVAPDVQLTQYAHFAWRTQDGYFSGAPNVITQTQDGFLWVGTDDGLKRFDGESFVPWALGQPDSKRLFGVQNLVPNPDGSLWIGALGGLAQLKNGTLTFLTKTRINGVVRAPDGTVWIAKSGNHDGKGFCSLAPDSKTLQCFGRQEGYDCPIGQSASVDREGNIWIGCNATVIRWSKGTGEPYSPVPGKISQENTDHALMAALDLGDGRMLIAYAEKGKHFGLQELSSGHWQSFNPVGLIGENTQVTRLLMDHKGGVWIGTTGQGLYHVVNGKADHYGSAEGLSGDDVASIYEDREGSVWVATQAGIDRFHALKMIAVTPRQGLLSNFAQGVATSPDGTVAVALTGGVNLISGGRKTSIRSGADLPGYIAVGLAIDHTGTVWASTDLQAGRLLGDRWKPLKHPDLDRAQIIENSQQEIFVKAHTQVFRVEGEQLVDTAAPLPHSASSLVADPHDGFWVMGQHGYVLRYQHHESRILAQDKTGLNLQGALVESDGQAWGWGLNGLLLLKNHEWLALNTASGLPCDAILSVIDDAAGSFWIYGGCGVAVVQKSELDAWAKDQSQKVHIRLMIDPSDGATGDFGSFSAMSARSPDGLLWFAWGGELQYIDTKNMPVNLTVPPVHIEQVLADHRALPLASNLSLPALTRDVQIDYAALSLVTPRKVRFRYRLSGVDRDWQDVGNRRQAFYMNLAPGHYIFQVIACNNDGLWNTIGDTLQLTIAPAYYQTFWFRLAGTVMLIGALWSIYLIRLRVATATLEGRLLERYSERERIARELHDTLLQSFQAIVLSFQSCVDGLPKQNQTRIMFERTLDKAESVLLDARDRIRGLRSKHDRAAFDIELDSLATELRESRDVDVRIIQKGPSQPLKSGVHDEMLAIIREALTNAAKHANASRVICEMTYERKKFVVVCADDGDGIPAEILSAGCKPGSFGLIGMRERARAIRATLEILRTEPNGTVVKVTVGRRNAYQM